MTRIRKELKIIRQKKKETDQLGKLFLFFCIISRSLLIVFVRLSLADLEFSPWFLWRVEGKEKNRTGKRLHAQIKFMSPICDVYYIRLYYLINLCCLCISIFRPTKTYFVFYFKHHILGKAFLLLVTVQINRPMKMSCTIGIIIHLHLCI